MSEFSKVISGVPQGSVLGPLLFLIMISDIDDDISYSILSSFADDTRIIKEVTEIMDTFKLQYDLNQIYEWTRRNNMKLNGCKFEHLSYGCNIDAKSYSIYLDNKHSKIETKTSVKDLGVIMTHDGKFDEHINAVVDKVNSLVSWILRTFESREKNTMLTLWKSLVIPHLDYCSQLWSPLKRGQQQKLELLQKNFLKKIAGSYPLTYWQQLSKFNMYSLERRRERYIIMYVWKILEKQVPNFSHLQNGCEIGGIKSYFNNRLGRKCIVPMVKRGPFQQIRCASLTVMGPRLFNCLPKEIRNISNCSKNHFKKKLDLFLRRIRDEPQIPNYVQYSQTTSNSIKDMMNIGLIKLDV